MDNATVIHAEVGNGDAITVADMVEASRDARKLPWALVAGGVGVAATALYLALFKSPAGLFLRTKFMFYTYYGVLVVVVLFGVAEAWAGLWISHDPPPRRAIGMTLLWVSILPLLFVGSVGGFAILK